MINYYQILSINKNSSQDEIKKAYRQAALFWHPDKNKSSNAHDKFVQISEAYEILSNVVKRHLYDKIYSEYFDRKSVFMNHSQSRRCLAQSLLCLCHIPRSSESCSSHHQQLHINASAPDCIPFLSAYERSLLCNHWQPYGLQPNTFLRCLLSRHGSPVQSIEYPDGCGV